MQTFQELVRLCEANLAQNKTEVRSGLLGLRMVEFLLGCPDIYLSSEHRELIRSHLEMAKSGGIPRYHLKQILMIGDNSASKVVNLSQECVNNMRVVMTQFRFKVTLEHDKLGLVAPYGIARQLSLILTEHMSGLNVTPMKVAYVSICSRSQVKTMREKYSDSSLCNMVNSHRNHAQLLPIQVTSDKSRVWSPFATYFTLEVDSPDLAKLLGDITAMLGEPPRSSLGLVFATTSRVFAN